MAVKEYKLPFHLPTAEELSAGETLLPPPPISMHYYPPEPAPQPEEAIVRASRSETDDQVSVAVPCVHEWERQEETRVEFCGLCGELRDDVPF